MQTTEARALGEATARLLGEVVTLVEGVHVAIAGRTPAGRLQGAITRGSYTAVRSGLAVGAHAVGLAARAAPLPEAPIAFLAGIVGADAVLAPPMRLAGLPLVRHTERIAVFVHGLTKTERSWWRGEQRSYGDRLEGWSAVYVRYDTGTTIADNAAQLHAIVRELVDTWPVPVTEVALIGHSMGGMVSRAAADLGLPEVTELICLGSPHLGADLATNVMRLASISTRLPETRPLQRLLDLRSAGVRDLERHRGTVRAHGARHTSVAATLTAVPTSLVSRTLGDGLVRPRSAHHDADVSHHVGGLHHLELMCHERVWPIIRDVLTR